MIGNGLMTMPPQWMDRWRGNPSMRRLSSMIVRYGSSSIGKPRHSGTVSRTVSNSAMLEKCGRVRVNASISGTGTPSALPTSRISERLRKCTWVEISATCSWPYLPNT